MSDLYRMTRESSSFDTESCISHSDSDKCKNLKCLYLNYFNMQTISTLILEYLRTLSPCIILHFHFVKYDDQT